MEVIEDKIERRTDLLIAADVVVLHNVFEFFLEPSDQVAMWQLLRATLRTGTLLVTNPALDVALSKLPVSYYSTSTNKTTYGSRFFKFFLTSQPVRMCSRRLRDTCRVVRF